MAVNGYHDNYLAPLNHIDSGNVRALYGNGPYFANAGSMAGNSVLENGAGVSGLAGPSFDERRYESWKEQIRHREEEDRRRWEESQGIRPPNDKPSSQKWNDAGRTVNYDEWTENLRRARAEARRFDEERRPQEEAHLGEFVGPRTMKQARVGRYHNRGKIFDPAIDAAAKAIKDAAEAVAKYITEPNYADPEGGGYESSSDEEDN